jgi:hypothetical protein
MADPTPASLSGASSHALSQFSFSLFVKLPAELQLEILSHCHTNDLVCLSLSSHPLRDLTLPLIPSRPSLLSFDQAFPTGAIECSCGDKTMVGVAQCTNSHRKRRHMYTYEQKDRPGDTVLMYPPTCPPFQHKCQNHSPCRTYTADHPVCHRPRCAHCSCTTCPLHVRLRGWMGDRKFCPRCRKFTVRPKTKKYKGRCECLSYKPADYSTGIFIDAGDLLGLHGHPPSRRVPNNRWTTKKGQSYGYRWWRAWGTSTVESWGYPEGDMTADISRRRNTRVV